MALNLGPLNVLLRLQGADKFQRDTQKAASNLDLIGKASVAATAAIAATGYQAFQATKVFAEFEKGMTRVGAVTNSLGTTAFAGLTERAQELASKTEFTARQVADAMGFMGMSGMSTNQIFQATPAVLQLASAGMVDVASAADTVTNIMSGYGLEAKDLIETNNVLVATFTNSNTSLQGLGETFKYAGPIAKGAGLSLKQTAAIIGLMGNAGFQASMAGTALRSTLIRLQGNLPAVRGVLEKYNIQVKDSTGKMKDFSEIFRLLAKRVTSTSDRVELFGQEAVGAMAAALDKGSGALDEMIGKIEKAGNVAERVSSAQLETLDGRIKIMQSNFEGLQISIGKALGPAAIKIVNNLSIVFGDLRDAIDGVGVGLLDSESWASGLTALKNLVFAVASAIDTIAQFAIKAVMFPITLLTRAIAEAEFFIGTMMKAFRNIPGMRGVYEAGAEMREQGISRRENLQKLMSDISSTKPLEDTLRSFFSMFESTAKSLLESDGGGGGGGGGAGGGAGEAVSKMLDFDAARARYLRQIAPTDLDIAAPGLVDALAQIGYRGAQAVKDSVAAAFTPTMIGNVISPLTEAAHALAKKQAEAAEAAAEIAHKFNKAGEAVTKIGGAVVSGRAGATFGPELGAMAGGAIAGAVSGGAALGLGSAIGGIVGGLLGDALDEVVKALGVLTPIFDLVADVLKPLQPVLVVIREVLAAFGSVLKSLVVPFLHTFVDSLLPLIYINYALVKAFEPLLVAIFSVANLIFGALYSPMILFAQALASVFGLLEGIFNVGKEAFNGFANAINTFFDNLRNIEVLGQKPFAGLSVTIPKIETEFMTLAEITAMETEAREESTRAIREFNEEMTNVPIGVKRLRLMQYSATGVPFPGMFNSSPF